MKVQITNNCNEYDNNVNDIFELNIVKKNNTIMMNNEDVYSQVANTTKNKIIIDTLIFVFILR